MDKNISLKSWGSSSSLAVKIPTSHQDAWLAELPQLLILGWHRSLESCCSGVTQAGARLPATAQPSLDGGRHWESEPANEAVSTFQISKEKGKSF